MKISQNCLKSTRGKCLEKALAFYILSSHCIVWNTKYDAFMSGCIPVWVIAFYLHKLHWQFSLGTVLFFISNLTLLLYAINTVSALQPRSSHILQANSHKFRGFFSSIPHCFPKPVFYIKFGKHLWKQQYIGVSLILHTTTHHFLNVISYLKKNEIIFCCFSDNIWGHFEDLKALCVSDYFMVLMFRHMISLWQAEWIKMVLYQIFIQRKLNIKKAWKNTKEIVPSA